ESLAEVSGAVEIDIDTLQRIEIGVEMPSEDILMLLMSHLRVSEPEARKILQLANYNASESEQPFDEQMARQIFMLMPWSAQVLYADDLEITMGDHGLVLNFVQPGANGQPMPVSRIGISYELAVKLQRQLKISTQPIKPKLIAPPKNKD